MYVWMCIYIYIYMTDSIYSVVQVFLSSSTLRAAYDAYYSTETYCLRHTYEKLTKILNIDTCNKPMSGLREPYQS